MEMAQRSCQVFHTQNPSNKILQTLFTCIYEINVTRKKNNNVNT